MENVMIEKDSRVEMSLEDAQSFILGGNALFTIQNKDTGKRFTFKVVKHDEKDLYFVRVIRDADRNEMYIGCVWGDIKYAFRKGKKVGWMAPSVRYATWLFSSVYDLDRPRLGNAAIYHHGHCGRCGRVLTVPDSIKSGIGPVCAGKI